jgi:hypothetical protein
MISDPNPDDTTEQIAHVFVDLLSIAGDGDDSEAFRQQIILTTRRTFELGAITFGIRDTTIEIRPEPLIAGAVAAMVALFQVTLQSSDLDSDGVLAAWRESIDT